MVTMNTVPCYCLWVIIPWHSGEILQGHSIHIVGVLCQVCATISSQIHSIGRYMPILLSQYLNASN